MGNRSHFERKSSAGPVGGTSRLAWRILESTARQSQVAAGVLSVIDHRMPTREPRRTAIFVASHVEMTGTDDGDLEEDNDSQTGAEMAH